MTHIKLSQRLITAFFNGTCSKVEADAVERYLAEGKPLSDDATDPLCAIYDNMNIPANDALADEAFDRCVDALQIGRKKNTQRPFWKICAIGAAVAACVLAIFVIKGNSTGQAEPELAIKEVFAGRGETKNVILPDGSSIILKSGSRLIYPEKFSGSKREVFLSGECYASVAKNPDAPFILSTSTINITVTGTEFNVKSFLEDSEAEVALVEGSVQVDSKPQGDAPFQSISITPGKVVKVDKKSGETRINTFDVDNYATTDNKQSGFVFLDQRFCDIVGELSRRLNVDIIIVGDELRERRFFSSFINEESLDVILESFNADRSMNISREGHTIKISKSKV